MQQSCKTVGPRSLYAASCVLCGVLFCLPARAQMHDQTIQYPTVMAALQTLLARTDVAIRVEQGWTIVTESSGLIWTFVPSQHSAYPTVMRQRPRLRPNGGVLVDMAILCQAKRSACDEITPELRRRNQATATLYAQKLAEPQTSSEPRADLP